MISLLALQHYSAIGNVPTHFDLSLVNETGSGNLKIIFNTIFLDIVGVHDIYRHGCLSVQQ